ncbi:hypothetical protein ACGFIJ_02935 [Microbispora bryophytorum]
MVLQDSPLLKAARLFPTNVRAEETGIEVADVLEYLSMTSGRWPSSS